MGTFWEALTEALGLLVARDPALIEIIGLSLKVTLTAVLCACLIGLPLGAATGAMRFPGRAAVVLVLNALMGLPPVVVGLGVYLMLSATGPLGPLGLLYTPTAMIIAQTVLVTPIIAALTRQVIEDLNGEYAEQFASLGVGRTGRIGALLWDARFSLLTVALAGFGRAAAEVGAGDHRRRQHQPRDPGDDHHHRARDVEGEPAPGARAGGGAAGAGAWYQRRRHGAARVCGAGGLCVTCWQIMSAFRRSSRQPAWCFAIRAAA